MSKVRHQAGKQADNRQVSAYRRTPTSRGEESFELRGGGRGGLKEGGGMKESICKIGSSEMPQRNARAVMAKRDGHLPSKPQLSSPPFTKMVCCPKFQFKAPRPPPPESPCAFLKAPRPPKEEVF